MSTAVVVLGVLTLAARPMSALWMVPLAAAGAAGLAWPVREQPRTRAAAVLAAGLIVVTLLDAAAPPVVARTAVAAAIVAAVCEEAFFRRLVYGVLSRWGDAVAVAAAALLFALVHVPVYGMRVLPLDFAAGLLFGWQRWATGSWLVPAATHAVANVLTST